MASDDTAEIKNVNMLRDGSLTPLDLVGKFDVLKVECTKCDRKGRYRLSVLIATIGLDGNLRGWLSRLKLDCPRHCNDADPCGVHCPDLPRVLPNRRSAEIKAPDADRDSKWRESGDSR